MKECKREISKENYDLIISQNADGYVSKDLESKFFGVSIIMGYGLYGARAYKIGDKYELHFTIGDSCD